MAKITNFIEARDRLAMAGLASVLRTKEKQQTDPQKGPVFVSVLPGEDIPPEYTDFRPVLQRDGLILLGWSRWNRLPGHGAGFVINWITSAPRRNYRRYASDFISLEEDIVSAAPARGGDTFFYQGIFGKPYKAQGERAETVFVCAPWDLNSRNIAEFIPKLKAAGVTTDFDFPYSMDYVKKLEFAREMTAALLKSSEEYFETARAGEI